MCLSASLRRKLRCWVSSSVICDFGKYSSNVSEELKKLICQLWSMISLHNNRYSTLTTVPVRQSPTIYICTLTKCFFHCAMKQIFMQIHNCCSVRVVWAYCCVIMHIASWCVLKQIVFTWTFISCKGGQVCIQVIIIQDCFSQYSFIWTFIFFFFLWNFISNLCVSPAWCDSCGEASDNPTICKVKHVERPCGDPTEPKAAVYSQSFISLFILFSSHIWKIY